VERWLKDKRPEAWKSTPETRVRSAVEVKSQGGKSGEALVQVTIEPPRVVLSGSKAGEAAPVDAGEVKGLRMLTIWKKDETGEYRLDVGRTLKTN
jgi:hypothetical protein